MERNRMVSKLIKIIIFIFLLLLLVWLLIFFWKTNNLLIKNKTAVIAGQEINIKLAKTDSQKELGLGKRESLPIGEGMLFVYDDYVIPNFWMKDMKFPIDIIWIKDDLVMGYEKGLEPQSDNINLPTYQPKTFINYVLEVNSGFVEKYGLKIGDRVKLSI